ncbi:MAG: hypothetical protein J1E61_05470 [Lachnospiraceae bacterium]|nr:hypothetical protein [Lachnospiraceae bacterium]
MKKQYKAEGSISIYLALTFTIMLSLILVIIEGAREEAVRLKAECAVDLSLHSIFAEYNRELLEQYDLFFIDTSYGLDHASIHRTEEHLKAYLDDNFTVEQTAGILKDLLGMYTEEVSVTDYSLASDEMGLLIKRQAVSYMKDLFGLTYVTELNRQLETVEKEGFLTRDVTAERISNQKALDSIEIPPRQVGEDEWEEVELNNPADAVNASRGILAFVIDPEDGLSSAAINPAHYISARTPNKGSGLVGREGLGSGDELVFNEYLIQKYGRYTQPKEEGALQYQLEYILEGKSSDIENLKAVVNKLLLLRETANVIYLFSDPAKMAEAEALAIALTAEIPVPGIEQLVKISLIFAWAYAESVYDVRTLLKGGSIPLLKDKESWHYSLSGMLSFGEDEEMGAENTTGIHYEGYLRLFLALENTEQKTMRAMDVIEMDIRKCPGNGFFQLDNCVDYIEAEIHTASSYGFSHEITRSFYYY